MNSENIYFCDSSEYNESLNQSIDDAQEHSKYRDSLNQSIDDAQEHSDNIPDDFYIHFYEY